MRLIYLSCLKLVSFSINIHPSLCTLFNMAGDTLALASVIRFRSSYNVVGEVSYTRCFMHPHRKKCNGFRSGERGGHSATIPDDLLLECVPNVVLDT
ncbi:hypothetical protein AVEN_117433-1 [Araneus ventricosus]|uniref:Uncharacterized protein n=1 Tax=Araneus ventricosus TaxID=182803 RepID=A0A4Y2I4I9_ARAVE|nr:hypothetical protein AVEN_117433-1 [Araneus ventricosus]